MIDLRISQALLPRSLLQDPTPGVQRLRGLLNEIISEAAIEIFIIDEESGKTYAVQAMTADALDQLGLSAPKRRNEELKAVEASAKSAVVTFGSAVRFRVSHDPVQESIPFALEVHVGAGHPTQQASSMIPLEGQFCFGVCNLLEHLRDKAGSIRLFQYGDLNTFISRTRSFYDGEEAGSTLLQKALSLAEFVSDALGPPLVAVFGSGFPFYVLDIREGEPQRPRQPPPSVRKYFAEQESYFRAKLLGDEEYRRWADEVFDEDQLGAMFGIRTQLNPFAADIYRNGGRPAPQSPSGAFTLQEWKAETVFALADDIWPCQLCSTLQFPELFPSQARIKHTNDECLNCRQTPLMLRNVMGAASDVDLIVVVRDRQSCARRLKDAVVQSDQFHLFDMDFDRTLNGDGPVDLFILEYEDVVTCMELLASRQWVGASVPATALWCPTTEIEARLDLSFSVSFTPILMKDAQFAARYRKTCRDFASTVPIDDIIDQLQHGSRWMEQVMSNVDLVDAVKQRLALWRS